MIGLLIFAAANITLGWVIHEWWTERLDGPA